MCYGSDADIRFGARRERPEQRDTDAEADESGQRAVRYSGRELYRHIQQPRRTRTNLWDQKLDEASNELHLKISQLCDEK